MARIPDQLKKALNDPKLRSMHTMDEMKRAFKQGQMPGQGPSGAAPGRNQGPFLDLWVRAGSDGLRNGADPACHEVFMALLIKSSDPNCSMQFNVKTVNLAKPHGEFVNESLKHVPAVVLGEESFEHIDEIQELVDSRFPRPSLQYFDPDADSACADLFSRFARLLKGAGEAEPLEAVLAKIDAHLAENDDQVWLCGGQPTHLDCHVAPTLHHVRVAAAHLKAFRIPARLSHLRRYMERAYATSIFQKGCPADQEIVLYWADKPDTPELDPHVLTELANQPPRYSFGSFGDDEVLLF